jgi:hypothetical protein
MYFKKGYVMQQLHKKILWNSDANQNFELSFDVICHNDCLSILDVQIIRCDENLCPILYTQVTRHSKEYTAAMIFLKEKWLPYNYHSISDELKNLKLF